MAIHPLLGKEFQITDAIPDDRPVPVGDPPKPPAQPHTFTVRIGHLRRELDLGIATNNDHGFNAPPRFVCYLVRLSTGEVIRRLAKSEQDFDAAMLAEAQVAPA